MEGSEHIEDFKTNFNELVRSVTLFYDSLKKLKDDNVDQELIAIVNDYIEHLHSNVEGMKIGYKNFSEQIMKEIDECQTEIKKNEEEPKKQVDELLVALDVMKSGGSNNVVNKQDREYITTKEEQLNKAKFIKEKFTKNVNEKTEKWIMKVEEAEQKQDKEADKVINTIEEMKEMMNKKNDEIQKISISETLEKKILFLYRNNKESKIDVELVKKYPGSLMYKEYMSRRRTADCDIFIDQDGENDDFIVKYMKDDDILIEDVKKMSIEKKNKLINDLDFLELPLKKDIIMALSRNEDNEMMEAWRNRIVVRVNGRYVYDSKSILKKYNIFNFIFANEHLKNIQYDQQNNLFYIDIQLKYYDVIEDYLKNGKINNELVKKYKYYGNEDELINEMEMIGIKLNDEEKKEIQKSFGSKFLRDSMILLDEQYDSYLREWCGDYKWNLIYRASEHGYLAYSFHDYCDDKGPTLVVIKSNEGWIFGGYTTQSWSGWKEKDDSKAFIFTLKNPHGVEPTRFRKRKESDKAIKCLPIVGPIFGDDICIDDNFTKENSCINNDGTHGYKCHPQYKSSLFVDKDKFSVADYELFAIDYQNHNNINKLCKYPDIIWRYIETKYISEESLKQFNDDTELLNDLNIIHCYDNAIRAKISQYYFKNPSEFISDTRIVNKQYDGKLREWAGDYKWKLIYRASEHEYTARSFHKYCDDQGPTLIVIKSSEGWIFGGYTTQSWNGEWWDEEKDDSKAFIFTLKNPHGVEPTRFRKRKESDCAIVCSSDEGPIFGDDICIDDNCTEENSCCINNDGTHGYECHPQYKSSLFVDKGKFSVLDYEVFAIDYQNHNNINKLCKYPDIIWRYIETKYISEEALKQFNDDVKLLNDLNIIHCEDSDIRFKISRYYFKNPSLFLPNTRIVNQQYDSYLREWCGDYKWKLIYRASEDGYSGESFHEYCNDKGPTLIVIKSSGGWIFGGYTTQSWSGNKKKDDSKAFIFTLKNPHGVEPTRFMKRKNSGYAIECVSNSGPIFGNNDIYIGHNCTKADSCSIKYDGTRGYECHSQYKSSLFVNTAKANEKNYFSVLDYEVYTHN